MKNLRTPKRKNSIKYGNVFRVGTHIVACGDARDVELVDRVLSGSKLKLICSDPPYGVKAVESKDGFRAFRVNKKILNDDIVSESEYTQFTKDWLTPVVPYLTPKNSAYIFNMEKMLFALREGMERSGVKLSQLLVWVKGQAIIGRKDYLPQHEFIAYGWHGAHDFKKAKDRSVLFYPKPYKNPLHPTQKPIELLRRLILNSTAIGDVVYDPFAGSGSTGAAAEQTKRSSILIERDEDYCRTILDRLTSLTGEKEVLIL